MRRKHLPLVVILGILSLSAATYWLSRPRQLAPAERELVGTWVGQPMPGGPCTVLLLNKDRTCRIRWLDTDGKEERARPQLSGRWWVEGGTLTVDALHGVRGGGLLGSVAREFGMGQTGDSWSFAIEGGRPVLGLGSNSPVTLHRSAEAPPRMPQKREGTE